MDTIGGERERECVGVFVGWKMAVVVLNLLTLAHPD